MHSVCGVNPMHLKDHMQLLVDENHVRVEKIGSGNWYWSFPSDEKIRKEAALEKAQAEKDKAQSAVEELEQKVADAVAARAEDDDEMIMEPGQDRDSMMGLHAELCKTLGAFRTELAGYSENDPVEVERRRAAVAEDRLRVDAVTDAICSMESWFKQRMGGDRMQLLMLKQSWYGNEFDEEAGGLREI